MKQYKLQENEVILFRDQISILIDGKTPCKTETEILLTNLNLVFINKKKQVFKKDVFETEVYALETVKVYNEAPYIIRTNLIVEVYLLACEKFIKFTDKKKAKTFHDAAMKAVSGNSKFVRAIKKVKKEINDTEEALDVDITGTAKVVLDITSTVVIGTADLPGAGKKIKTLGMIAKAVKDRKEKKESKEIPTPLVEASEGGKEEEDTSIENEKSN